MTDYDWVPHHGAHKAVNDNVPVASQPARFKVGDRVRTRTFPANAKGKVVSYENDMPYPVMVLRDESTFAIGYKENELDSIRDDDVVQGYASSELNRIRNINALVDHFHGKSKANGWWPASVRDNPLVVSNKLALIHSEISEAMEGDRKNAMDDKLLHRKMIEVELADALIRICDLAGFLNLDLGGATVEKDAYNDNRADHKAEARSAVGGKAY